ncbi:hypothetical protein CLU79DRAFT_337698 [Phycomyces nitens]|nr:hypothetical protein CLU79DRAFT_337698 [Phycomyces nitens]
MATRTPLELEQDIAAIDQTLSTVSEIRSSLSYFTRLVQAEKKEPQYVQEFSIRLNAIKRELNKLSVESEGLRGQQAKKLEKRTWETRAVQTNKKRREQSSKKRQRVCLGSFLRSSWIEHTHSK